MSKFKVQGEPSPPLPTPIIQLTKPTFKHDQRIASPTS